MNGSRAILIMVAPYVIKIIFTHLREDISWVLSMIYMMED